MACGVQVAKCPLFCDAQSCDQCHPDNNGCELTSHLPLRTIQAHVPSIFLRVVRVRFSDRLLVVTDTAMAAAMKKGIGL